MAARGPQALKKIRTKIRTMTDRQDREDRRREGSLLALGSALRGDEEVAPAPSWREDAAARHRLTRSRREAAANPLLAALAEAPGAPEAAIGENVAPAPLPSAERPVASASALSREKAVWDDLETDQRWKPLIDPMKIVGGIVRSKWLILGAALLGAALGVAVALSTPKKYEAVTELIVDPRDLKLTDSDLTQNMYASDATLAIVENQARVLTSGVVLNKVVEKLDLADDPEFNGQGGGGFSVRSALGALMGGREGGVDEGRRWALAVDHLARSLSVERGGKTFVITIGVTTLNGEKSALIANTMTDVFLQTYGEIQSDTAGRATEELTGRLAELRKGVEEAERKAEDFRAAHDLIDAQGHLISEDELAKLNEQLSVARARALELKARAASARSADLDAVLGGVLPEELNSNAMAGLRAQYAALKQEADRAAVKLGPRHPERQALEAQLSGARERIAAELRRIASSLKVDQERAVQLEQELSSRLAQLKVRSGDINNDMVTLRELQREANAQRAVYESFLLRARETGERRDINTANVSVISKAYAPLTSLGPSRAVISLTGLLLGLFAGIGIGVLRGAYESLRETARSPAARGGEAVPPSGREGSPVRKPVPESGPEPEPVPMPEDRHWPSVTARYRADIGSFEPSSPQPAAAPQAQTASIAEIRADLRDFREAVRDLADTRMRRRYF